MIANLFFLSGAATITTDIFASAVGVAIVRPIMIMARVGASTLSMAMFKILEWMSTRGTFGVDAGSLYSMIEDLALGRGLGETDREMTEGKSEKK